MNIISFISIEGLIHDGRNNGYDIIMQIRHLHCKGGGREGTNTGKKTNFWKICAKIMFEFEIIDTY